MTARLAPTLTPVARELVRLADRDVLVRPRSQRAKSPAGAYVLMAAALTSPLQETAEAVGLSVVDTRALVHEHVDVGQRVVTRLRVWVLCVWLRAARDASPEARASLLAAVWAEVGGSPAPLWAGGHGGGLPPRNFTPSSGNDPAKGSGR